MKKILILGGYGNFGTRISQALVKAHIPIILVGRNINTLVERQRELQASYPQASVEISAFDLSTALTDALTKLKPLAVINTVGPFQLCDYSVPKTCIQHRVHYIDLADARHFVTGILAVNDSAQAHNVLVVSGASTVPGLSSAVVEKYQSKFASIESMIYGISPGQKTASRGLATTKGVLTYLGKPLKTYTNHKKLHYGWQDLYRQTYPQLGKRWMANCDIPDVDIFPEKYKIKTMRFSAGTENPILHLGMWLISWFIRLGLPINLPKHAQLLLKLSYLSCFTGSADGGMHILLKGKDHDDHAKTIQWFIIAKNGHGPQIPCVPAIILAKKLFNDALTLRGAMACTGLVTVEEYLAELQDFDIQTIVL
jgi:hypothetical protein